MSDGRRTYNMMQFVRFHHYYAFRIRIVQNSFRRLPRRYIHRINCTYKTDIIGIVLAIALQSCHDYNFARQSQTVGTSFDPCTTVKILTKKKK